MVRRERHTHTYIYIYTERQNELEACKHTYIYIRQEKITDCACCVKQRRESARRARGVKKERAEGHIHEGGGGKVGRSEGEARRVE